MKFLVIGANAGANFDERINWCNPFVVGEYDTLKDAYGAAEHSLRQVACEYAYDFTGDEKEVTQDYWDAVEEYERETKKSFDLVEDDFDLYTEHIVIDNKYDSCGNWMDSNVYKVKRIA